MVFGSIIASPRGNLSLQQTLDLANLYLENASKSKDPDITLVLCHDTEVSLTHVKKAAKVNDDESMHERIATVYVSLGNLLDSNGHRDEAQAFYKKSGKWGGRAQKSGQSAHPSRPTSVSSTDTTIHKPLPRPSVSPLKQGSNTATALRNVFPTNVRPPTMVFSPLEPDSRLNDTPQLACCLALLQSSYQPDDLIDPIARNWLRSTKNEPDEQERLKTLATDVVRAFKRDEFKNAKSVTEVVYLAPVLENDDFRYLLKEFYMGIDQSGLLDIHQLEGLARVIQGADPGYIDADDLAKVLSLLSTRLSDTHQQSANHLYQLTVAVSHVLDAMADADVKGLDREKIHEPLSVYLDELKESSDPYLVYQAAYAYQALLCVPDNESLWQATLRRTGKVIQGVSGLVSAVKGLDLNGFIKGLENIQQGLIGAAEVVHLVKSAYGEAISFTQSGQGFFECLKEGLSFSRKCAWYSALRGADTLIRDGQFAELKKLICEAPCRRDPAFQWGVCQRLGVIAADSKWDTETRQGAITFLGEIYRDDVVWGHQSNVKQWIVSILMQLSSIPGGENQAAETLLQELGKEGDATKQAFYRLCRENGSGSHPLKIGLPPMGSPSLLDHVQERPDVEGNLRQLRRQRLKERGKFVYIPPQAKANLQARDEARLPLMEMLDAFLSSDQKVFLLLGDSGAGKSTFNRELECHLWQSYKKGGVIPLHINLPALDRPEHDMIAKQLRRVEFTEPQIRELKAHRKFLLICDGYDESQQNHNLYTSNRLNQSGEWNAKMVISCRSEYLGVDYRDRFQPGDRNRQPESGLFQEAVITPFSVGQVQDYITQYVSVYRPLWEVDEYKKSLDVIPSLKELVKNPFLMSLSLEVLPRMVDPGQDLSTTQISRMALYDQFIEHWLERGKRRLGEKNLSPQARSAFESLIDEGFTRNGIDYLKKLSAAIYKEQGGQPIVTYSRYKDENSWKQSFFSREEEKQILREVCPLIRSGNQHRFIHRSMLEYGVSLAIFDPQDWKERIVAESSATYKRNGRPVMRSYRDDGEDEASAMIEQEPDFNSPIVWRSFVNESSVLQFLEERVHQDKLFEKQLFGYIERSKTDDKWCVASANAITILIRAGVQFNSTDLRGIQIPYADLSYGMFESAQLQGADLRQVDLRGAWLRKADLSDAQMAGVQFGELPYLEQECKIFSCVYSPDGKSLAVGLEDGKMIVYSTSSWETLWILEGHSDGVNSITYSSDSNQIVTGSDDKTARLWDIQTGNCIYNLNGHDSRVASVAYSPQGDQVASASDDTTAKVWSVQTGKCCLTLNGHTDRVLGVIYSPKGNQIASNSDDCTVRLWDTEAGKCLHVLRGHSKGVMSVAYSAQGDQVASASYDRTVGLWDVVTGDCRHILTGHEGRVFTVMFSPNGSQLATSSADASVGLWDVERGVRLHTLRGHNEWVRSVVYSPQGDLIASASHDKTVRLWDTETGVCRQTLTGHSHKVFRVVFSPKEYQVASISYDMTVRLWNVGARMSQHFSRGHNDTVRQVKSSPKGDFIATCSDDYTVRIWDVETGVCRQILRGYSSVYCVAYSPQGDQIATGSNIVQLWNARTGTCTHSLTAHNYHINAVAYPPHGYQLASASYDRTVRLWDGRSGECSHVLTGHTKSVTGVMYSPSGNQVVTSSVDSTLRIWDVDTGICNHILTGHTDEILSAAYSLQGDHIVSSSKDTAVRVWNVSTGEGCELFEYNKPVQTLAYSPRGNQIACGDTRGSVQVWATEARTCLWNLTGHTGEVNKILYSSQGDVVISASDDESVRLWDVTSGQCHAVIQGYKGSIMDIAWIESSGINYLVAGCLDGFVGMWQVRIDDHQSQVSLRWMSTNGKLDVEEATVQGLQGLSPLDMQLLKQRGAAVGEPAHRLREASKKVTAMTSAVSTLKDGVVKDPDMTVHMMVEQLQQRVEQVQDPLFRNILSGFVRDIISVWNS
ncbi:MAG: WD40-repeat-containing domain protein [Benniella sp.]|nr:MAG: WD40-repeat-containing domain protein [Benniella sp.]